MAKARWMNGSFEKTVSEILLASLVIKIISSKMRLTMMGFLSSINIDGLGYFKIGVKEEMFFEGVLESVYGGF